jgi:hypothetical protein
MKKPSETGELTEQTLFKLSEYGVHSKKSWSPHEVYHIGSLIRLFKFWASGDTEGQLNMCMDTAERR